MGAIKSTSQADVTSYIIQSSQVETKPSETSVAPEPTPDEPAPLDAIKDDSSPEDEETASDALNGVAKIEARTMTKAEYAEEAKTGASPDANIIPSSEAKTDPRENGREDVKANTQADTRVDVKAKYEGEEKVGGNTAEDSKVMDTQESNSATFQSINEPEEAEVPERKAESKGEEERSAKELGRNRSLSQEVIEIAEASCKLARRPRQSKMIKDSVTSEYTKLVQEHANVCQVHHVVS